MDGDPVELDEHRGMAAQKSTERYLIQLFASTPEGRDPCRQELILQVLEDLTRLSS
jgi:hypothetical protein